MLPHPNADANMTAAIRIKTTIGFRLEKKNIPFLLTDGAESSGVTAQEKATRRKVCYIFHKPLPRC
jgi:hypothetical protein